jgi:hypothetical protein
MLAVIGIIQWAVGDRGLGRRGAVATGVAPLAASAA